MGVLMKTEKNSAIKKIAKNLQVFLTSRYGYKGPYTQGQVAAAVSKTKCNPKYIDHAYAMFCDEAIFNEFSTKNFSTIHQEIADICFNGDSDFTTSDITSYYSDSYDFNGIGSDCGGCFDD